MRSICTSLLVAACLTVPVVTRAQASQSFVIRGCADNAVTGYTGTRAAPQAVFGRLACFVGTGVLTPVLSGPDLYAFVFDGGLETTLGTDQTRGLATEIAPTLTLTSPRSARIQAGTASLFSSVGFSDGYTTPLHAFFYVAPGTSVTDYTGGTLDFYVYYNLDSNPRFGPSPSDNLNSAPVSLSVTAAPEPAPLALVTLGGLTVLGAGARRRARA